MPKITAALVKELREKTGAGMMDCKKALSANNSNIEESIDWLRTKGLAAATKKAGRLASEGLIGIAIENGVGALVEVNSETDFVARNEKFQEFIKKLADQVSVNGENDLLQQNLINGEGNVEGMLTDTIAELGENMQILNSRKFKINHGLIGGYIHSNGKIGVVVPMETDLPCNDDRLKSLAKDIAMHIAAFQAEAVKPDQVPEDVLEKEKEVFTAQARESGKPENIIEKMIEGRLKKYVKEICVESQPFVKDPQFSVSQIVEQTAKELGVKINFDIFEKFQF